MENISMDCFCGGKHCQGNIYIQPDRVDGTDVFMVTVVDTSGNDEASLWLTPEQLKKLGNYFIELSEGDFGMLMEERE